MSIDRTALVTGASRGIGKSIAGRLADDGFFVVGTSTTDSGVENIEGWLGDRGIGLMMRVEDSALVEASVQRIFERCGDVSVLINNAGITRDSLLVRMKDDEWDDVIETNLAGTFRLCKSVLRSMIKARWGRIVNVGSVVGRMGNPGQTNYAASKAGIEGFTRALAQEVGSRGITVNCVAPGFIDTDMTAALGDAQVDNLTATIPLGRIGSPRDVASAVSFLVSEDAGYITGETLNVNGGLYSA
jgi:3-oxoacyl-[acyl-carrier protein] reductase|uniref:3-oxoacyl-[acyl-carrier-protein] reductase n=1 Tax=uncultured actinobacterium HF0770_13M05 TaxID=723605 RepID=E7C762_9ACTN|nr:dehydrogenases with different specificities (related to short-chain alcohol dehydrogenases) [uncultured actinobacterium HF0770_13M05]|tara:strand:- start:552 stop:1283 length:732 start_codon:yes stop_codon:yes gene_type:complete